MRSPGVSRLAKQSPRFDYPTTRRDDAVDVLHGTPVADPYRWLEEGSPEVASWFEQQDKRARRAIAGLHGVDARWAEILALWKPIPAPLEIQRGKRSFHRAAAGLVMKTAAREETIFETSTLGAGVRLNQFVVSPDGLRVALELSKGGADMRTVRVLDATTKALLDEIGGVEDSPIVWASKGFFYAFTPPDAPHATRFSERRIRFHVPGSAQENDREVVPASHDKDASSAIDPIGISDDGARLLARTYGDWAHSGFAIVDLGTPGWNVHALTARSGEVSSACVLGRSVFVAIRNADGSSDIARVRDPDKSWEITARVDARFLGMRTVGAYLVLRHARGAGVRNELYDSQFRPVAVRETAAGLTETFDAEPGSPTLTITRQGLSTPPIRLAFDLRTRSETTIASAPVDFDSNAFTVESIEASSSDGTRIPITILRRKDVPLDGTAALWAYGYGGFRNSAEQEFFPPWVAWAIHGGVFAICHVRGGLEYGEAWHEAGSRRNRQNTIDDFAACLRELHRAGYSSPRKTMTQGWSHGAMLVSAVAVQHPDLQRVVLATVPLADMIRFPIFGRGGVSEYGDPDDAGDFRSLLGFSPYHNVKEGTAYPAFFITASANDERAAPMHARKLAAALQHASSGGEVLLKVNWGAGHHGGGPEDANRAFAEATVFALRELGSPM